MLRYVSLSGPLVYKVFPHTGQGNLASTIANIVIYFKYISKHRQTYILNTYRWHSSTINAGNV